jgi:hypothetical protein
MASKGRDDPHRNIPKDAKGVPIFLILPTGIRTKYERQMAACERAWLATRDPLVIDRRKLGRSPIGNHTRVGCTRRSGN